MTRLPTVFVSHGAPTFALEPGLAGPQLSALGRALPRPQAVLVVSPHWMTQGARVGLSAQPATIHDFGGFPQPLYEISYPAHGHPELAQRTLDVLRQAGWSAHGDERRGLDHGAWVPLLYLYPEADVPVFQVSLPATLDSAGAWAFGRALAPLAEEGVLIVGSGSLTHNLYEFRAGHGHEEALRHRICGLGARSRAAGRRCAPAAHAGARTARAARPPDHRALPAAAGGCRCWGRCGARARDRRWHHARCVVDGRICVRRRTLSRIVSVDRCLHQEGPRHEPACCRAERL